MTSLDVDPNENFETNSVAGAAEAKPVDERSVATLQRPKGLAVTDRGGIALRSIEDQLSFAQRLISERMISDTFKTPQQVVIGFQYAKAMGLNEVVALRMMYVVNGKPSLFGDGPLSLCQRNGELSSIREFFYDKEHREICFANKNTDAKVYGACVQVMRKGDAAVQEDYFTTDDMARAGLDSTKYGKKEVWAKWERIMIRYKARTMALKSKFADLVAGINIAEYDDHFTPEHPEARNVESTVANRLNEQFLPKEEA